jgi:hypothetical protein
MNTLLTKLANYERLLKKTRDKDSDIYSRAGCIKIVYVDPDKKCEDIRFEIPPRVFNQYIEQQLSLKISDVKASIEKIETAARLEKMRHNVNLEIGNKHDGTYFSEF